MSKYKASPRIEKSLVKEHIKFLVAEPQEASFPKKIKEIF